MLPRQTRRKEEHKNNTQPEWLKLVDKKPGGCGERLCEILHLVWIDDDSRRVVPSYTSRNEAKTHCKNTRWMHVCPAVFFPGRIDWFRPNNCKESKDMNSSLPRPTRPCINWVFVSLSVSLTLIFYTSLSLIMQTLLYSLIQFWLVFVCFAIGRSHKHSSHASVTRRFFIRAANQSAASVSTNTSLSKGMEHPAYCNAFCLLYSLSFPFFQLYLENKSE